MKRLALLGLVLASSCAAASFEPRAANQFAGHVAGRCLIFDASGTVALRPGLSMRLAGSRPGVLARGIGRQAGRANYFLGADPQGWRTGAPLFDQIRYPNVYPGVDLIYHGTGNLLEYDFVVAPGASWRAIRLAFRGAEAMQVDRRGDLQLKTKSGWIAQRRPRVYQDSPAGRREIAGRYVLEAGGQVRFEIGKYDRGLPLVIDPTLVYASYLGGSGDDYSNAVAVDSSGCAYVVGETWSTNFPLAGPHQALPAGNTDIFITKWNAAGNAVVYSTYLGGSSRDAGLGIAVDAAGNAYITGFTYSANFPVTSGALRTSFSGQSKAFAVALSPDGGTLTYSTYLGGSGSDYGVGIAVDASGQAHVSGYTASLDFPVTAGAFQRYYGGGSYDGFLAKLNAAGSALLYATYLGGNGNDTANGVAVDSSGNIYVTGQTQSSNFPLLNALQTASHESDAFVVKMTGLGQVFYATYLGGTGINAGSAVAADSNGNVYVTGSTTATDFPVTFTAFQAVNHGGYDAFAAKLSADGGSLLAATYLGGSDMEDANSIALDSSGNIYIAGSTQSMNFPVQGAVQSSYGGAGDAFLAVFNNQLSGLYYSTFFGGAESESGTGVAVDSSGAAYLTGFTSSGTSSAGLPVTAGVFQPTAGGGVDAFLAKFAATASSLSCSASTPAPLSIPANAAAQLVGDVVLSCTGGTPGTRATAQIEITLNAPVAIGVQPELLIDDPPPAAQVLNQNLFAGFPDSDDSVLFQNVSFAVPGAGLHTLRITNVAVNTPSTGQVTMAVAVNNANPPVTPAQFQATVAVVQAGPVQLQASAISKSAAPPNCAAPPAAATFSISDPQALAWFLVSGAAPGDVARADWYAPAGSVYRSYTFQPVTATGTQCFSDALSISGAAASMAGGWKVNVYWNGALLYSAPFSISTTGVEQLLWQNNTTHQVNANYYGGTGGATLIGWACLNCNPNLSDWRLVGAGDFDRNGVPDLVWQNTQTGQVNVNYYGGAGGTTITGWAVLNSGAGTAGWSVVAVADMNGDHVPDLIWQNSQNGQVNVNYYGGAGGVSMTGWAVLNSGAGTAGWHVVAAGDFDGNGVPDLVWQYSSTGQVNVNYYGGSKRTTLTGFAVLNSGKGTAGWHVLAAADFNGDGVPDLIWQNLTTGQVNVNYYGGSRGAMLTGWACLNPGVTGWLAMAALN
jgi:Beta-propeller repeat/FG-GAP-like repeat